jgi:hypothetical protein
MVQISLLVVLYTGIDDSAAGKTFISGASNDVITQNGTTKGGLAGSIVQVTAIASAKYAVAAHHTRIRNFSNTIC